LDPFIISLIIFALTYILIATEKVNRTIAAFFGAILLILFKVLTLNEAINYISWETIGLLFGMFLIVTALSEAGFFTYLALITARALKYSPIKMFIVFPLLTWLLSGFMDSITVMLFFATLTYQLCKMLKIDPTPLIVTEVVLANIGGAATLVGDPPNVILGLKLGFYFNDFVIHNGPIAFVAGICALTYCYLTNRKALHQAEKVPKADLALMDPKSAIEDMKQLKVALIAFFVAILFLTTHTYIEQYLNLGLIVPLASMGPAFMMLAILGKSKASNIVTKIDYEVILFFMGLFIVVGGIEQTGVISIIASFITETFSGNHIGLLTSLMWGSGVASGVIDNVPFALSMAYVLDNMVTHVGVPALSIMVWATSLGLDIGGNFTPIGASANLVAYSAMERKGLRIGWKRWVKIAVPASLIALIVSNIGIYIKYMIGFY
jgi:Na+/H+ antiporter NhaD/arsenite permease-like protein